MILFILFILGAPVAANDDYVLLNNRKYPDLCLAVDFDTSEFRMWRCTTYWSRRFYHKVYDWHVSRNYYYFTRYDKTDRSIGVSLVNGDVQDGSQIRSRPNKQADSLWEKVAVDGTEFFMFELRKDASRCLDATNDKNAEVWKCKDEYEQQHWKIVEGNEIPTWCSKGHYTRWRPNERSFECGPCPRGTSLNAVGKAEGDCKPCDPGTYGDAYGLYWCKACRPGRYTDTAGQDECKPCGKGSYTSEWRSTKCTPCPAGSSQGNEGGLICELCKPGTSTNSSGTGATLCPDCPAGSISGEGASWCQPCRIGTYEKANKCPLCLAGHFCDESGGTSKPKVCPKNTWAGEGASACTPCSIGLFAPPNSTSPDDCVDTCPDVVGEVPKMGPDCEDDVHCLTGTGHSGTCNKGTCSGPGGDVTGLCDDCPATRAGAICQHKVCKNSDLATSDEITSFVKGVSPAEFDWTLYKPENVAIEQVFLDSDTDDRATVGIKFRYRPIAFEIEELMVEIDGSDQDFGLAARVDPDCDETALTAPIRALELVDKPAVGTIYEVCLVGKWNNQAKFPPLVWGGAEVDETERKKEPQWCSDFRVEFLARVDVIVTDLTGTKIGGVRVTLQVSGQSPMLAKTTPENGKIEDIDVFVKSLVADTRSVQVSVISATRGGTGGKEDIRLCPAMQCSGVDQLVALNTSKEINFLSSPTTNNEVNVFRLVDVSGKQLKGTVKIPHETAFCVLPNAKVAAINPDTGEVIQEVETSDDGSFALSVPLGTTVKLEVTYLDHVFAGADDDAKVLLDDGKTIEQSYVNLEVSDVTKRELNFTAVATQCDIPINGTTDLTLRVPSCSNVEVNVGLLKGETSKSVQVPPAVYTIDNLVFSPDDGGKLDASFKRQFPSSSRMLDLEDGDGAVRFVYQPEPDVRADVLSGHARAAYPDGALPSSCGFDPGFDWALESGLMATIRFEATQTYGGEKCELLPIGTTLEVRSLMTETTANSSAVVPFFDLNGTSVAVSAHRVGLPAPSGEEMDDFVRLVKLELRNEREWPEAVVIPAMRILVLGERVLQGDSIVAQYDNRVKPLLYLYAPPVSMPGVFGSFSEAKYTFDESSVTRAMLTTSGVTDESLDFGIKVVSGSNVHEGEMSIGGGFGGVDVNSTSFFDQSNTTFSSGALTFATPSGLAGDEADMVLTFGSVAKLSVGTRVSLNVTNCAAATSKSIMWGEKSEALLYQSRGDIVRQREIAKETMATVTDTNSDLYRRAAAALSSWDSLLRAWDDDKAAALADNSFDVLDFSQIVESDDRLDGTGFDSRHASLYGGETPPTVRPQPGAPASSNGRGFAESLDGANARAQNNQLFFGAGRMDIDFSSSNTTSRLVDYDSSTMESMDRLKREFELVKGWKWQSPVGFESKLMGGAYLRSNDAFGTYTEDLKSTVNDTTRGLELHTMLKEDRQGDNLCLTVHRSPHSGTFVFDVCGGRTSCPHIPGTDARHNVTLQLVEAPEADQKDAGGRFVMRIDTLSMLPEDSVDLMIELDAQSASFPLAFKIGSATLNQPFALPPVQGGTTTDVFVYYERLDPDVASADVVLSVYPDCEPSRVWKLPVALSWGSECPQVVWGGDLEAAESTWTISSAASESFLRIAPLTRTPIKEDITSNVTLYMKRADVVSADWLPVYADELNGLAVGDSADLEADDVRDYFKGGKPYMLQLRLDCKRGDVVRGTSRSALRLGLFDDVGPKLLLFTPIPYLRLPARRFPVAKLRFDEPVDCLRPELSAVVTIKSTNNTAGPDDLQADADVYCSVDGSHLTVTITLPDPISDAAWSQAVVDMVLKGVYDLHGNPAPVAPRAVDPTSGNQGRGGVAEAQADGVLDGFFTMPKLILRTDSTADAIDWALPSRNSTEKLMAATRAKLLPSSAIPNYEVFTKDDNSNPSSSPGTSVGAIAGGVAAACLVVAAVAFAVRRKMRQRALPDAQSRKLEAELSTPNPAYAESA